MATTAAAGFESPSPKPIAPWWHTVLLVAIFLALAIGGAFLQRSARQTPGTLSQHPHVVPLYLTLIAMEYGLFIYVWKGARRTGTTLRDLVGGRWAGARDVLVDVGLGLALWGTWSVIERAWLHYLGAGHAASIQTMLPQGLVERILWIVLSLSAGFSEELVFRGYLQKQFQVFTHSRWIALFLQAALFGISHGYQGTDACLRIALFGALFGLLALWRRSLRPGMVAHAWTDICSGLFGV